MNIIEQIRPKSESVNNIPVDEIMLTREEFPKVFAFFGELEEIIAECYVVISILSTQCGREDDMQVNQILDNCANLQHIHKNVIPFRVEKS